MNKQLVKITHLFLDLFNKHTAVVLAEYVHVKT